MNQFQLLATDFDINADHIDPNTGIEFSIVHQGCTLYLYLLPILYYDIQYLVEGNHINTANCDCNNGIAEFTIIHQGCALYLYIVPILYYDIQYLMGCNNINHTNCYNNLRHTVGLLFLPPFLPILIEKKKKIDNTSKNDVNDNNKTSFLTMMNSQSSRSMIMIVIMVKNNQLQVYDDVHN